MTPGPPERAADAAHAVATGPTVTGEETAWVR